MTKNKNRDISKISCEVKMGLRVGITYNLKKDVSLNDKLPIDFAEEFDSEETIDSIKNVLESEGHKVYKLGGDNGLIERLKSTPVDIVFNIAEGLKGRNREAHIPAILEFMDIPYTGSDPLTLSLTLDKSMAKRVVASEGIATPKFKKINRLEELNDLDLRYPLFLKLCYEGSSKGIRLDSKIKTPQALREKASWLLKDYDSPILIEEFINGPEFTVGIIGNYPPEIIGVMQIEIKGLAPEDAIYSLEVKREWEDKVCYHCPPSISQDLLKKIKDVAIRAYKVLECRDVSRVDIRVGEDNIPYFLEINPLPGLSPIYGDLPIMARLMGWKYEDLIKTIFNNALKRYGFI